MNHETDESHEANSRRPEREKAENRNALRTTFDFSTFDREAVLDPAFLDAGFLAGQIAQIVELGAANLAVALDFDLVDVRAVEREDTLDAFAIGDAAHGDGFGVAGSLAGNHGSGEYLDAFFPAFFDFVVDANGVADHKVRMLILLGLFLSDFLYGIHKSLSYLDLV